MNTLYNTILDILFPEHLVEMANVPTKYTGVAPTVMISSKYAHDGKESRHGPRIKVSNVHGKYAHDDNFSLTVEHEPRVIGKCKLKAEHLDAVKDFVRMNHEHLHKVWHEGMNMDPHEIVDGLSTV